MKNEFNLIGIDGGASKVAGYIIDFDKESNSFTLTNINSEIQYSDIKNFNPNFTPVPIKEQLKEFEHNTFAITEPELRQGEIIAEACRNLIINLKNQTDKNSVLFGIGMPGLKTKDKRGVAVCVNGPRILELASIIEKNLLDSDVELITPIACLGSDADYCGIGEEYANLGSFKDVPNAYYLGGGTGTADALKLGNKLIPLDQTKKWLAKTWEMKNENNVSLEKYTSFSGIQSIYSDKSQKDVNILISENIYVPQIAINALEGEKAAIDTFRESAQSLAKLLYERITTLSCGWQYIFKFINKDRPDLEREHFYLNGLFDRIVLGQRLGDFLNTRSGFTVLAKPLYERLSKLLDESFCLSDEAKEHYLHGSDLKRERLVISQLREAPVLGAGIDAYLKYSQEEK